MNKTMTVDATIENLYPILDVVDEELAKVNCDKTLIADINVCIEEIFVNIASYAYGENTGQAEIDLEITKKEFIMVFRDSGTPYNPLARANPDIELSAEERGIGGLGIFMVKEMMDSVTYEYKEKKNCLRITKNIPQNE